MSRIVCVLGIAVVCALPRAARGQQGEQAAAQVAPQNSIASPPPAAAQAPAQASAQAQPPKAPPLPNRLNQVLPSWLRVRGEFRDRMEGPDNAGFASNRDDLYWLNRFRFDVGVKASRQLAFQVQLQDARVAEKDIGVTGPPFRNVLDLRQAYADIGDTQKGAFFVRAGRQEMVFGEQRLVGHLTWVNVARSFDGVKATVKTKKGFRLDTFATSVVRAQDGEFDSSGAGNQFYGAYGSSTAWLPKATVEPYVFFKADRSLRSELGGIGDLALTTFGTRWVGKLPAGFDYGLEMAGQTGSLASDDMSAWAGHWIVGNTLGGKWKVRVAEEYNFASGDSNPTDGRRGTFDQLYPTGHDKLGLSDQIGWRNIHNVRSIVELTPYKGWPVSASHHSWWLANTNDALYTASGAATFRVPGGAVGSFVGTEIDVQVTHAITQQIALAAGYAHVFPGTFLKKASPGAEYSLPYVMVTYVFLADR